MKFDCSRVLTFCKNWIWYYGMVKLDQSLVNSCLNFVFSLIIMLCINIQVTFRILVEAHNYYPGFGNKISGWSFKYWLPRDWVQKLIWLWRTCTACCKVLQLWRHLSIIMASTVPNTHNKNCQWAVLPSPALSSPTYLFVYCNCVKQG